MRTTNAVTRKAKKQKILSMAVGLRGRKKNCVDIATGPVKRRQMAITLGRKQKRRMLKTQWILRLSAFLRQNGLKYSTGIGILKSQTLLLNGVKAMDARALNFILETDAAPLVEIINNYKKNNIK